MKEVLLLKCGEIVLKGLNKPKFEKKLLDNIKFRLKDMGECNIYILQSTIYIEPADNTYFDEILLAVQNIFGITTICRAVACSKNIESILETAGVYLADKLSCVKTFKVESKRADKKFPLNSIQLSVEVGGYLHEKFGHLIPDMHTPDTTVYIEVRDRFAYIHFDKIKGAGGMPSGTSGKALLLLSGGIDSPVAGYMMAKRGLSIDCVHFYSYPYTSERALDKVKSLAKIVSRYSGKMNMHIVPFTKIQEEIKKNCPEDMMTIIMRRFMMKISNDIALNNNMGAIITGESLAQVASQTMEAMFVTQSVCDLPVFSPVIGMDKDEITIIARKIGSFETSILPYEDCCTVFTPKHPVTKPKLHKIEKAEEKLDVEGLINDAINGVEILKI